MAKKILSLNPQATVIADVACTQRPARHWHWEICQLHVKQMTHLQITSWTLRKYVPLSMLKTNAYSHWVRVPYSCPRQGRQVAVLLEGLWPHNRWGCEGAHPAALAPTAPVDEDPNSVRGENTLLAPQRWCNEQPGEKSARLSNNFTDRRPNNGKEGRRSSPIKRQGSTSAVSSRRGGREPGRVWAPTAASPRRRRRTLFETSRTASRQRRTQGQPLVPRPLHS